MRNKILLATLLLACLVCTPAIAQQNTNPQPDRWHNLTLDHSTPNDATRELGKAVSDKTREGKSYKTRILTFKKVAGMKEAQLMFKDGLLVAVLLKPNEKINADALPRIYGLEFVPKFSGLDEAVSPQDYERNRGQVFAKTYPAVYELLATAERSRVRCLIDNDSFGAILKQGTGVRDEGGFPGHVVMISLLSKTLDDTKGADILK